MKRIVSVLTALILVLSCLFVPASARGTKQQAQRSIAIVFDNSSSMYEYGNLAWCQATYATEVFASMMNEGDMLYIYPMHEITANGKNYTMENPLTIRGGDSVENIAAIEDIYTLFIDGDGTPIETITRAHDGLLADDPDTEKWLIVLTDGDRFHQLDEDGEEYVYLSAEDTKSALTEMLNEYDRDVNVIYLGIGDNIDPPELSNGMAYTSTSDEVCEKLTDICNNIFGRDNLPSSCFDGSEINIDVDMTRMIAFIQGDNISNVTLKSADGSEIPASGNVYTPHYSERGGDLPGTNIAVDPNLSGVMISFSDVPAGTYTLSYSGTARSRAVYYEPDVDLSVWLTDAEGNTLEDGEDRYPGDYVLHYGLTDKDDNPVESALLGDVNYALSCRLNGDEIIVTDGSPVSLSLAEGDTLEFDLSAAYLSGYQIQVSDSDFGWSQGGFQPDPWPDPDELTLSVSGAEGNYSQAEIGDAAFRLTLNCGDEMLTGAELAGCDVTVENISGGNLDFELSPENDCWVIRPRYDGLAADIICGDYILSVRVVYTNEYGKEASASGTISFTLEEVTHEFSLSVEGEESSYQISKLAGSDPFLLTAELDGERLTGDELRNVMNMMQVDVDGLDYEMSLSDDGSAIRIQLTGTAGGEKPEKGDYTLSATARYVDEVGNSYTDEITQSFKLRPYPAWLPWVIVILILLILVVLFLLFMNMKVMPKKITYSTDTATASAGSDHLDGIDADFSVRYTRKRKSGTIIIQAPDILETTCSMTLHVTAASNRWVRSGSREVLLNTSNVSVAPDENAQATVGAMEFTATKDGTMEPESTGTDVRLRNGAVCSCEARYQNVRGRSKPVSMQVQLLFK